jgi:hypothetical protein
MPQNRTLGSLIATLLIGALTFFFASPKKTAKAKTKSLKTSVARSIEEIDDLFI